MGRRSLPAVVRRTGAKEGPLTNILAIDGARNCVYDVFQVSDADYMLLFKEGTDIAFAEDFDGRADLAPVLGRMWLARIPKPQVQGIHGTYFIGLEYKKAYDPTRRDEEARNPDGSPCRRGAE